MRPLLQFASRIIASMYRTRNSSTSRIQTRDRQARQIVNAVITLLLVCMAASAARVHAADDTDFRNGVVRIESRSPEGKLRKGAGFIVSVEDDAIFIVTAAHVVQGDKTPRVELFTRPLPVEATVARQDLQLDIAVLVVRGPAKLREGLLTFPLNLSWQSEAGQQVTTIGFPAGLSWAVSKPNIASQEGVHLAVVGGNIDEGSSGGPVLNNGMVVGMVTTAQRGAGRAIPSQILELMLRGWRVDVSVASGPIPIPSDDESRIRGRTPDRVLTWERELGQTMVHEIHPTRDGNYIFSGYKRQSTEERAFDAIVAKLSLTGEVIWERSFTTGGDDDLIYSISELPGGGYAVGGDKGGEGAWIALLDDKGEIVQERTFPELTDSMIWRVRTSKDGNIVFAGSAHSDSQGRREVWIGKLDRGGNMMWSNRYWNPQWKESGSGTPFAFRATSDGGYVVAAVHGGWAGPIWIFKLNAKGDMQWKRSLRREGTLFDVIESKRGGYVFVGQVRTGNDEQQAHVTKLDRNGEVVWDREIDPGTSECCAGIAEMPDGSYLAVGESIVRLDAQGMSVSKQDLGDRSFIISIDHAPDGGYIAAGMKNRAIWVLKLDAEGMRGAPR